MTDQVEVKVRERPSRRWLGVLSIVAILGAAVTAWYGQGAKPASTHAPPNNAAASAEVVYNAAIAPQFTRAAVRPEVPVVRAGVSTVLRFGLGARWPSSDLPPVQPNASITGSATDVPLTVLLACSFCDAPRSFQGNLVYRPKDRESNVIDIRFKPAVSKPGDGQLEVSVYDERNGAEYDRFVIDVNVSDSAGLEPVKGNLAMPSTGPAVGKPAEPSADVILDVAADSTGSGVITVKVTPLDPALQASLAPRALGPDGRWRTFKTALIDQQDIERITTRAYGEVTALVMQGDFLRVLRRVGQGVELRQDVQEGKAFTVVSAKRQCASSASTVRTCTRRSSKTAKTACCWLW